MKAKGIVYVLTNPAMKDIVKIGKTTRKVDIRITELYKTGVPLPFECAYAAHVKDEIKAERALHQAFAPYRINNKREFFKVDSQQVIALLKYMELKEEIQKSEPNATSKINSEKQRAKRQRLKRFTFSDLGIPNHSCLTFGDKETTCIAWDHGFQPMVRLTKSSNNKSVDWKKGGFTLHALTRKLLGMNKSIKPFKYWQYEGKSLEELMENSSIFNQASSS